METTIQLIPSSVLNSSLTFDMSYIELVMFLFRLIPVDGRLGVVYAVVHVIFREVPDNIFSPPLGEVTFSTGCEITENTCVLIADGSPSFASLTLTMQLVEFKAGTGDQI